MNKLTIKQQMVLECIKWYISNYQVSPTIRELAHLLKSDPHSVFEKIMILEEKGYIKTTNGKARSIILK